MEYRILHKVSDLLNVSGPSMFFYDVCLREYTMLNFATTVKVSVF